MSIHSTLAVLLGSTALGGYAPLTLLRAQRFYLTGIEPLNIGVISNMLNTVTGIRDDLFTSSIISQHAIIADSMFRIFGAASAIILGFTGLMPTVLDLHTAIQESELDGYGYLYGESYGD